MEKSIFDLANTTMSVVEFTESVDVMDYDQLSILKAELDMVTNRIKAQLDTARSKATDIGQPVNAEWFNRAKVSLRYKAQFVQIVERRMGKVRRVEAAERSRSFAEAFVSEARSVLEGDTFRKIFDLARENSSEVILVSSVEKAEAGV